MLIEWGDMAKAKAERKKAERKTKYRITSTQTEPVKKKPVIPKVRAITVKRSELGDYLYENENSGKTMRELLEEFREQCPHNFIEIAHLAKENRRYTYQTCRRCGLFATNRKSTI
jgi:hypothetical protein